MSQRLIVTEKSTLVGLSPEKEEQNGEADCNWRGKMWQFSFEVINIPGYVQYGGLGDRKLAIVDNYKEINNSSLARSLHTSPLPSALCLTHFTNLLSGFANGVDCNSTFITCPQISKWVIRVMCRGNWYNFRDHTLFGSPPCP